MHILLGQSILLVQSILLALSISLALSMFHLFYTSTKVLLEAFLPVFNYEYGIDGFTHIIYF